MSDKWPEDGLLKTNGGAAFKTENAVKAAAANKGIKEGEYRVVPYGDGFAAERIKDGEGDGNGGEEPPAPARAAASASGRTGFRRVVFHPRSNTSDPEDVVLSVNGNALVIKRGVETILPEPYLEAAEHTKIRTFRQVGRDMRKEVVELSPYPYQDLGAASREEYMAMLRKGTRDTVKALEREGQIPLDSFNTGT